MSKNTIMIIVLVVGLGIILAWQFVGNGTPQIGEEPGGTFQVTSTGGNTDSDNDGAPDWEELLWGYDPNNPDTGNEGRLDGLKIKEKKSLALEEIGIKPTGILPEENVGAQFGQDLYSVLALLEENEQLTPGALEDIKNGASDALLNYSSAYIGENIIEIESLLAVEDSVNSVSDYIKSMETAHNLYPVLEDDFFFVQQLTGQASSVTNEDFRGSMSSLATKYGSLISELKQVPVPRSFLEIHYEIINNLDTLYRFFDNLSAENIDESKTLIDSMLYMPALHKTAAAYEKIINFMVVFSER